MLGSIVDLGVADFHRISVLWGDGGIGDGFVNPIEYDPGELSFQIQREFSSGAPVSLADLYPLTLTLWDDDNSIRTVTFHRPLTECVVTGFAVYSLGTNRVALDKAEQETGVPYFGDGLFVNTVAEGTGDVSRCIFERTVKSTSWRTEFGNKVVLRNDVQPRADGPATTPAKPFGSGLPGGDVRQRGDTWRYSDMDIPSFGQAA